MSEYANVIIRASAGTGKTFQLSNRFLGLLHAGAPVDEILATTFTRKAAGEILDRVIERLAEAALDEKACQQLSTHLGGPELSIAQCRELLAALTRNLHRLHVSTLDSFFSQLAGTLSLEAGLPPGWRIVDELEDNQLRNQAIAEVLRSGKTDRIVRLVNLMTKGAAERSVSELVRSTVSKLYDLYMVTPAEAWQTVSPPARLSDEELVATIERLRAAGLPEGSQLAKARDKDVREAEADDWEELVRKGLAAKLLAGETTYGRNDIPPEVMRLYQPLLRHARAVLMQQLALQTTATHDLLDSFATAYRQLKNDARAMRFDDVTRHLAELESLDPQQTGFRLDARISHLLLDEFQDTSPEQWRVLRPFARRATARQAQQAFIWSGQSSLFCVGDVKQAIYGWRGGVAEIFDAMESELDGLTQQALNQSWRSSPVIIDTVNRLFTGLTRHSGLNDYQPAVRQWQQQFAEHTTAKTNLPGYAELVTAPAADDGDQHSSAVTLDFAACRVAEIVRRAPTASVGVLVRRNESVAQLIYKLRNLDIAASEEGGNPLTDSAAVQAVVSLLQLADHPGDSVARSHVANTPLGPLVGLTAASDDQLAARVAQHVRNNLQTNGYGPAINGWVQHLAGHCHRRDYSRLSQLVEMAYRYHYSAALRTARFLELVREKRVSDPTSAQVRVMTIHQAKGLEFDVVVLPELDARLVGERDACVVGRPSPAEPPNRVCLYRNTHIRSVLPQDLQQLFRQTTDRAVREALCVLYVAVTRAIHALHMIVAPSPSAPGKTYSGLLRAALADGQPAEPDTTLFQTGDPNWFQKLEIPQTEPTATPVSEQPQPWEIRLKPTGGRRTGVDHTSPSRIARGRYDTVSNIFRDSTTALARGSLIHAWFQQIRWLDDGRPSEADLRRAAQQTNIGDLNLDELIGSFSAMLDQPTVAGPLTRQCYEAPLDAELQAHVPPQFASDKLLREVYTERSFAVRDDGRLLTGSIDRLVLLRVGTEIVAADVIDFKTDHVDAADSDALTNLANHYQPQLGAYRTAVAKTFGLTPNQIATRLLFVSAGVLRAV